MGGLRLRVIEAVYGQVGITMGKRYTSDSEQIGPQSPEADDLVQVSQPLAYPASADVCFEPWFVICLCETSETGEPAAEIGCATLWSH